MRRLWILLAVAGLALACGVPEDDAPQELSADDVPFGLLTTAPTTTTTPVDLPPSRSADLYFVNSEDLIEPIEREVDDRTPETIIQTLLDTDTAGLPSGLTSNIPPDTELVDLTIDDNVVTLDLTEQFTTVEGERFIAAVAQLVFTATDITAIDLVSFRVDGDPIPVSDEDGAAQDEPVSRIDYRGLLAAS